MSAYCTIGCSLKKALQSPSSRSSRLKNLISRENFDAKTSPSGIVRSSSGGRLRAQRRQEPHLLGRALPHAGSGNGKGPSCVAGSRPRRRYGGFSSVPSAAQYGYTMFAREFVPRIV